MNIFAISICLLIKSVILYALATSQHQLGGVLTGIDSQDIENIRSVFYLSWIEERSQPKMLFQNEIILDQVSAQDDSPYSEVRLPFPISIFGSDRYYLYASSNGALHLSPRQACSCHCFMSSFCNFNTSYSGVLAGFLTDLDPSNAQSGNKVASMTVGFNNSDISFTWENFPFFVKEKPSTGMFDYNSFRILLKFDGTIVISWDQIHPNSSYMYAPAMTGLRLPSTTTGLISRVKLNPSQVENGRKKWATTTPGIYPALRSQMKSGNSFFLCPVSSLVTVNTSNLRIGSHDVLKVSPLSSSCSSRINIFALLSEGSLNTPVSELVPCILNGKIYECPILSMNKFAQDSGAGIYNVTFVWTNGNAINTNSYNLLPWNVSITVYKSTESAVTKCDQNLAIPEACDKDCSLFYGNITCLGLLCPQNGVYYDVNALCASTGLPTQLLCNGNLLWDGESCCDYQDQDCTGVCHGTAQIGKTKNNDTICCAPPFVLDCQGICNGPAVLDGCGSCNGPEPYGSQCGYAVILNVKGNSNPVQSAKRISGEIDLEHSQHPYIKRDIVLFNPNNTDAFVQIGVIANMMNPSVNPNKFAPDVNMTFLNGSTLSNFIHIQSNKSVTVSVRVSFDSLFDGTKGFASKQLEFLIQRPSVSLLQMGRLTLNLDIYFSKCNVAGSRKLCTNLPGCVFCLAQTGILVYDDQGQSQRRHLYPDILPIRSSVLNVVDVDNGACIETGARSPNEACAALLLYGSGQDFPGSHWQAIVVASVLAAIILLVYVCNFFRRSRGQRILIRHT